MPAPQTGLFFEALPHHHYLEFCLASGTDAAAVRMALARVEALQPKRDRTLILGFSKSLWEMLGGSSPNGFTDFPGYSGHGYEAPATQADLWVWVQGAAADGNLHTARAVAATLADVMTLTLEQQALAGEGNRDLIGFVDGTGNPKTWAAKEDAALIPDGSGGSILLTQTWEHNLPKFEDLSQPEQEAVIGRTKHDDIELEGDDMPANSHVSRTDVSVGGTAQKIYRRSAVVGTAARHGLYFVAFACEQSRHDIQLKRMYAMTDDDIHDRLLEFSSAVTGSYFYVPGRDQLADVLSAAA